MFITIIKGFKDKKHLLDVANQLYNTRIDKENLTLEIKLNDKDKIHKLSEWIIKELDKTKELYYDVVEI